jgi:hypothetical protein
MPQWMLIGVAGALGGLSVTLNTPLNQAPDNSIGSAGIDAYRLQAPPYNLTGRKIAIGQVEIGRPGKFGVDKAVSKNWANAVTRVFFRDSPARVNTHVDPHAQNVASIMVSNDAKLRGIAPEARLYSSAVGLLLRSGQPEECMSAQHIALQNGGDVRTINFSFGESLRQDPRPQARLDGNALLTQCVDWSSRVHNVLYVVAGNQGRGGISIPTDNFNGINVAFTSRLRNVFAWVDPANLGDVPTGTGAQGGIESNVGPRRSISLVAPGSNITVVNPDGRTNRVTGTSFATPHVTASVALLQEYGDTMLRQPKRSPTWSLDSRNHEVMKAVLMNAADKVRDPGDGLLLGMSRTIFDRNQQDWFASDAYRDRMVPLNLHMGTGQLNTFRAYQQFSAGQWSPEAPVPAVGWDYRTVSTNTTASQFRDYVIDQPLQKDSFVAATLAWARRVELQDQNQNGKYDIGENFSDRGLNNLDIYLMPAEAQDPAESVWASVSEVDSVEHIFHRVPATGRYKIRVRYHQQVNQATQPYALAWWTVPAR